MKTDNQTKQEWMQEHDVHVIPQGTLFFAYRGDNPDKCYVQDIALGETEDEALENLAIQKHWGLWK